MSSSAGISDKIMKKLEETVDSENELKMIIDLLGKEQNYTQSVPSPSGIKDDFKLLLKQYYPLPSEED